MAKILWKQSNGEIQKYADWRHTNQLQILPSLIAIKTVAELASMLIIT